MVSISMLVEGSMTEQISVPGFVGRIKMRNYKLIITSCPVVEIEFILNRLFKTEFDDKSSQSL